MRDGRVFDVEKLMQKIRDIKTAGKEADEEEKEHEIEGITMAEMQRQLDDQLTDRFDSATKEQIMAYQSRKVADEDAQNQDDLKQWTSGGPDDQGDTASMTNSYV